MSFPSMLMPQLPSLSRRASLSISLMMLIALLLPLSSLLSAYGGLAEDIIAHDARWSLGEGLEEGDVYGYLICVTKPNAVCYEATLEFAGKTADDFGSYWIVNARIQEVLGYLTPDEYGYLGTNQKATGDFDVDSMNIRYAKNADPANIQHYTFLSSDRFELKTTHPAGNRYADSIYDTIMLIGGKISVGSGNVYKIPPIIRVGEEWVSHDKDFVVIVTSKHPQYQYENLFYDNGVHTVKYLSDRPIVEVSIADGIAFPLEGKVLTDTIILRDTYVDNKFWFKLIHTSKIEQAVPDIPETDPAAPDKIPKEPATAPELQEDIPQIQNDADNAGSIIPGLDIDSDKLYEQFLEWLDRKLDPSNPASSTEILSISTEKDFYTRGETISFDGIASRTSVNSFSAIIQTEIEGMPFSSIPVSIDEDGTYHIEVNTSSWDIIGKMSATINHGTATATTSFDFDSLSAVKTGKENTAGTSSSSDAGGGDEDDVQAQQISFDIQGRIIHETFKYDDSVVLFFDQSENAVDADLVVRIPRDVLDARDGENGEDTTFVVYLDGKETEHTEDNARSDYRTLTIPVFAYSETLEIVSPLGGSLQPDAVPPPENDNIQSAPSCIGNARCIETHAVRIIDGDTIKITGGQNIRFALASAPELSESAGPYAKDLVAGICPVGSEVIVDEDDFQTQGSYERIIGVIHCNGVNLNEYLLESGIGYVITSFCNSSEFGSHDWAVRHGC